MAEYVCLNCWHLFPQRVENAKSRGCSNCKSRMIISLDTLVEAVKGAKDWLAARRNLNLIEAPIIILKELPVLKEIFKKTYFPRGIEAMSVILKLADDWDDKKLTAEEHVVLALRRMSKGK